jgi:hypothetical protein
MENENFNSMRKRVLRDHKQSIIRSAMRGLKDKGRGLVMIKFIQKGKSGMVHISYWPLEVLKLLPICAGPENRSYGIRIIKKIAQYSTELQIPIVVTDGESERFSFGIRQAA